jgi:endonuclease YncB( thermonuclease family)
MYVYRALVDRVIDGDGLSLAIDLGFFTWLRVPIRIAGINARELRDPGGPEARDNLAQLLPSGCEVIIRSLKPGKPIPHDKYAPRWDALLFYPDWTDIATMLVTNYWAALWDGRGPAPKPPWPRPVP